MENCFRIFIRIDGKVLYSWIKEIWSKVFFDGLEGVKNINMVSILVLFKLSLKKNLKSNLKIIYDIV